MLVKEGYDDKELGKMKMEKIYKLKFMKYVENYISWYGAEKRKKEAE